MTCFINGGVALQICSTINRGLIRELITSAIIKMDCELYNAAVQGEVDILFQNREKFLFQLTPKKNTLLHIAALNGETESVNVIQKECPSLIYRVNDKDETPLHFAAMGGHVAIVEALIKRLKELDKEDVESGVERAKEVLTATNKDEDTALHMGVQYRHLDVVKLLVNEDRHFVYQPNNSRESPLYTASERGLDEFVAHILDTCISPSYDGPLGRNALHAAVIFNSQGITEKLLKWNQDLPEKVDYAGWTPIHYAARLGHVQMVTQLLHFKKSLAYLITQDTEKKTALHIATSGGHVKVMELLITTCPDCCELLTGNGQNILHLAVMDKRKKVIDFILTRFTWTRYIFRRFILKKYILTEMMVNNLTNQKDMDGNTPLHLLARSNFKELGSDLIKKPRVEMMVFNNQNMNPVDIACSDTYLHNWPFYMRRKLKRHGRNGQRMLVPKAEDENIAVKKEVEDLRKLAKTHMIVAILIATVTFAAGFTMPGGYEDGDDKDGTDNNGMAVLAGKGYFRAFVVSDTLAMALSFCAIYVYFMASAIEDKRKLIKCYSIARTMVTVSAQAMVFAFLSGIYVVLEKTYLKAFIPIIGTLTFLCFFITSKRMYNRS